jgi:hypothetical protein
MFNVLDKIRRQTVGGEKYLPQPQVDVHDNGKILYVRLKPQARQA